jgi:DNA-directed RNA polymerase specialized sigma24 family protein
MVTVGADRRERATTEPTTRTLVDAASRGDATAWNALVDRFAGTVWAAARGYGLATDDATAVCHTTWLEAAAHLDRLHPECLEDWLTATTRREAVRVICLRAPRVHRAP